MDYRSICCQNVCVVANGMYVVQFLTFKEHDIGDPLDFQTFPGTRGQDQGKDSKESNLGA